MAENNQLSTLWLSWSYAQLLALEQLRLGERLKIDWHTDHAPMQARLPPLIPQPLLENAVISRIRAAPDIGMISVTVYHQPQRIAHRHPPILYQPNRIAAQRANKMAMAISVNSWRCSSTPKPA